MPLTNTPPFEESSFEEKLRGYLALAEEQSSWIQTVGMSRPVRIEDLFQRPSLQSTTAETRVHLDDLILQTRVRLSWAVPGPANLPFSTNAFTACSELRMSCQF